MRQRFHRQSCPRVGYKESMCTLYMSSARYLTDPIKIFASCAVRPKLPVWNVVDLLRIHANSVIGDDAHQDLNKTMGSRGIYRTIILGRWYRLRVVRLRYLLDFFASALLGENSHSFPALYWSLSTVSADSGRRRT